ncbi:hypothetical protein GCM10022421_12350 [Oceanisphaera sediminis]|uniref:Sulfotransferase n=1 Tax=Oceanisphaera sediminis TaxID=981381 RepID=A0ABP7DK40_9GAMM
MNKYLDPKRYFSFFMNKLFSLLSPVVKLWEKRQYRKYSNMPLKHQPVFIIGAPRTGSTILYQTITNQFDVLYIDNLVCKFNKNFFFGFWLSNKLFKQKAHNCFSSNHGATKGLRSPSECGGFWYRWLPRDRHFIDHQGVTDKMVKEIREEISSVINKYDKPLVFKNLNAGQRLRLLSKAFPEAKFIYARREPEYTAQSILLAKRKLGIKENSFWSIMPKSVSELNKLEWPEQIVRQIFDIEKQISEDSALFEKDRFSIVNYLDLNQKTVSDVGRFLNFNERQECESAIINLTERLVLNESEISLLNKEIKKLDWSVTNVK